MDEKFTNFKFVIE